MSRVVLVHGAVDRAASYADVVAHLAGTGGAESYDRRGYGSAWERLPDSMEDHIDDLLEVVGDRPCTVVGHSMGGLVALGAALRAPDLVTAVGLYETALPWETWWTADERAALVEEVGDTAERALAGADPSTRPRLRAAWEACLRDVEAVLTEPFPWADVSVPVTVASGSASTSRSARDVPAVAARLGCAAVLIEGAGNQAHRTHAEAYARFVAACRG